MPVLTRAELVVGQALDRLHDAHRVVLVEESDELAGVDEARDVARAGRPSSDGPTRRPGRTATSSCRPIPSSPSRSASAARRPRPRGRCRTSGCAGCCPCRSRSAPGSRRRSRSAAVVTLTRSRMPRTKALSRWNRRPRRLSMKSLVALPAFGAFGTMSPGRPRRPYPATDRKSRWPPCPPVEHVRAGHVGAAGEVDADERDLARALHGEAAACLQRLEVRRQRGLRGARVREQAEQGRRDDRGGARDEALRDELPPRDRPRMVFLVQRRVGMECAAAGFSLHQCKTLIAAACWRCR